jgi:hypothetical protein
VPAKRHPFAELSSGYEKLIGDEFQGADGYAVENQPNAGVVGFIDLSSIM